VKKLLAAFCALGLLAGSGVALADGKDDNKRGEFMKRYLLVLAMALALMVGTSQVRADDRGKGDDKGGADCSVQPIVSLAYADSFVAPAAPAGDGPHPGPAFLPSPWQGDPGVIFIGAPEEPTNTFDAGAIKVDNPSTTDPLVVAGIGVDIGPLKNINLWAAQLPATIPPGGSLIVTQNTNLPIFDFDTSDLPGTTCTPDGLIPVVHVTVGVNVQTTTNYIDTTQIINTGGFDKGSCPPTANEGHEWTVIKATTCPCHGHLDKDHGKAGSD